MSDALSLLECQRRFMAALYAHDGDDPCAWIAANGLAPAARMRVYRHACEAVQGEALRVSYPAVLALVGAAYFDQCALGYRRMHVSRSGNLQAHGERFADYLATLPGVRGIPYLPDVARLEWLRQQAALSGQAVALAGLHRWQARCRPESVLRLHPSLHSLRSQHAVYTIFRYAMQPEDTDLQLPDTGENVLLWREGDAIAMAVPDAASFACVDALAAGKTLAAAAEVGGAVDPGFDVGACVDSLMKQGLIVGRTKRHSDGEAQACR